MTTFSAIAEITSGKIFGHSREVEVTELLTDSRKVVSRSGAVFFCIAGIHHDGHDYIASMYERGIRLFVVERKIPVDHFAGASFIYVQSSIEALQAVAADHRSKFSIPIIGITGSNGKTIIKEWLNQLLSREYSVVKSPASYNSQIGVALSVWQLKPHHQLAIFEAGISKPGEMPKLERMIRPTIGVFTNIGTAHDENFESTHQKIEEKMRLFEHCDTLICNKSSLQIYEAAKRHGISTFTWGYESDCDLWIQKITDAYNVSWKGESHQFALPFHDEASIENAFHCLGILINLGYKIGDVVEGLRHLKSVPMRLELKAGINNSQVIDDTYNNDLGGLRVSLDFLANQYHKSGHVLILSDILQSGLPDKEMVQGIAELVNKQTLSHFIGIGPALYAFRELFELPAAFYLSTEEFLERYNASEIEGQVVLVKGARKFQFERIASRLQRKVHGTVMEVDLGALVSNLNYFRSLLSPSTRLMVMVKAFAYGSGNIEVANLLQFHKVNYLGVAYADEGVDLRRNNIGLPIMVMNPSPESFQVLMDYNLEPEIYGFGILQELIRFLDGRPVRAHLKIDTGMHRLGFEPAEVSELVSILTQHENIKVESIFSHLAGSDDPEHDNYSAQQVRLFKDSSSAIEASLGYNCIKHVLNTSGILRFPDYHFDMVRLGIGLYGVDPTTTQHQLSPVATLKTVVSQVRRINEQETVGYSRKGVASRPAEIATIAIGYADGFSRAFGNGVGMVLIKGKRAPIIGNVCMDMSMVDVTGLDVHEGDEVIVFGKELPLHEVAESIHTIPYEILTNTSDRVKRVFVAESI